MLKIEIRESKDKGCKEVFFESRGTTRQQLEELGTLVGIRIKELPQEAHSDAFELILDIAISVICDNRIVEKTRVDFSKLGGLMDQEGGDK